MSKDIIVIKLGGSIFEEKDTSLDDIATLYEHGQKLVIVHGGAAKVSLWLSKMNIPVEIVDGERATTSESLEVVTAVLSGLVNKEITAALLDKGVKACGLSGVDGSIINGKMRGGKMGLMGDISRVNITLLQTLLNKGFTP
ncbi:MAG: acetylglutamate kinase, partial [Chloroflexi bacterium]|nr:acetylglutamate kinase [Chloroflexota bacterium]